MPALSGARSAYAVGTRIHGLAMRLIACGGVAAFVMAKNYKFLNVRAKAPVATDYL